MSTSSNSGRKKSEAAPFVHRIVLTGGPCGGKTTVQTILSDFFENLGWKVYRVPETATILLGGGVNYADLNDAQASSFQSSIVKTMMQIEQTYVDVAMKGEPGTQSVIIYDRGCMDPSAYTRGDEWNNMMEEYGWTEVELRDTRYDQIIHVTTAAIGAENFYGLENNFTRSETIEQARAVDKRIAQAWVGHPYLSIVDNRTGFKEKCNRIVRLVCKRLGLETKDSLGKNRVKRKFLITSVPNEFPVQVEQFDVRHDYLPIGTDGSQTRIRRRGQCGIYTYTHTVRKPEIDGQHVEVRKAISAREYATLLRQRDPKTNSVYKTRICFLWEQNYYQMDVYSPPYHPRCQGLILLETSHDEDFSSDDVVPPFLNAEREVTECKEYSMHKLAQKESTEDEK
eukprot:Nk52_evm4s169 gene=Nk52_evmTU4s169